MRWIVAFALLTLAACSAPSAGIAIDAGSGGVSVSPSVRGNIGGLSVAVRG